jgi:DNA primase catalytic core
VTTDRLGGRKTLEVTGFLEEFEKEAVKKGVDIIALFGSFGVELVRKGKSYTGRCPWHEDSTPSLSVDREKGLYHCFGCGESGDVVSLVQKMRGVGFREALAYLAQGNGKTTAGGGQRSHTVRSEPLPARGMPEPSAPAPAATSEHPYILDEVAKRYASTLTATAEARAYLATRKLDVPELLTRFGAGYSDGRLAEVLGAGEKAELERLGLLKASGREHFAGCITVPLWDEADHVVGFYGRRITSSSQPAHLFLPGPHRGLVNRQAARVYREELVLTESVLDALSLIALGLLNVLPCYGTNGFTSEHAALLSGERVQTVAIGFDADEAGRRGAEALAAKLETSGHTVKLLSPPRGKDWNEYLVSGGTAEELRAHLAQAVPRAAAAPASAQPQLTARTEGERKLYEITGVRYRVAGAKGMFVASLRVNVRAEWEGRKYIDNVDLLSARSRQGFAQSMGDLVGLEPSRVERDLVAILEHLESERDRMLSAVDARPHEMSEEERREGLALLKDRDLVERVLEDLEELGYVGERENKLLVYLAATSRRMADPLSVLIVSESASGKSLLIESVKRLMPPEEVVAMTSLSDQALQYLPEDALLHKFLVMGEAVHSLAVEHQVREMLSSRELSRLVTLKDERTGELSSRMVRKPVVVSCALSTTNPQVNPENSSRFFVVGADETEEQTRAIFARQREKYSLEHHRAGEKAVEEVVRRHQAAQRLLTPRLVVNPFARALEFPSRLMRSRRDHERFLDLIAAVSFLRQYQKPEKEHEGLHYIESDLTDYRTAYTVMQRAIASSYGALPLQPRALYEALRAVARRKAGEQGVGAEEVAVSQRELREAMGMSAMGVKRGLRTLVDYEYVLTEGSRRRGSRLGYRLLRDEEAVELSGGAIPTPEAVERELERGGAG